jgi:hypothetical protein
MKNLKNKLRLRRVDDCAEPQRPLEVVARNKFPRQLLNICKIVRRAAFNWYLRSFPRIDGCKWNGLAPHHNCNQLADLKLIAAKLRISDAESGRARQILPSWHSSSDCTIQF